MMMMMKWIQVRPSQQEKGPQFSSGLLSMLAIAIWLLRSADDIVVVVVRFNLSGLSRHNIGSIV